MLTPTNHLLTLLLQGAVANIAAGPYVGPLYQPHVGLFIGSPTLSGLTSLADLNEAAFTGYGRQQITLWSQGYLAQDGRPGLISESSLFWKPGDPVLAGQVLTGWFLVDTVAPGGLLLAAEYFATPCPMQLPTDALSLDVFVGLDAMDGIGYGEVVN
jgi:hypothetical protein